MDENGENSDGIDLDKALFYLNAVTIPALGIIFTLEALGIGAHTINAQIGHLFMGLLFAHVTMKRAARWGRESTTKRKGEWIALGFLAYTILVLVPLFIFLPNVVWPSLITPISYEIIGLLAGNEVVKAIDRGRRKNKSE